MASVDYRHTHPVRTRQQRPRPDPRTKAHIEKRTPPAPPDGVQSATRNRRVVHHAGYRRTTGDWPFRIACRDPPSSLPRSAGFRMSALVILECNACGAITPPWPSADRAREEAGPDGWAVDVDGSNIDYCQQCTGPAGGVAGFKALIPQRASRIDRARDGVTQLRDALAAMCVAYDATPTAFLSVANLARIRADQLLAELAA